MDNTLLSIIDRLPAAHPARRQFHNIAKIINQLGAVAVAAGGKNQDAVVGLMQEAADVLSPTPPVISVSPPAPDAKVVDMSLDKKQDGKGTHKIPQYECEWPRGMSKQPFVQGGCIILKSETNGAPFALPLSEIKFIAPSVDKHRGTDQNKFSLVRDGHGATYIVEHPFTVILGVLEESA